MKLSKALSKIREEAAKSPEFWVERAKLDFAIALEAQRRSAALSYKQIADAISSSAAYISKVFRGDSNLTIETMVKLAHATGGRVEIRVIPKISDAAPRWDIHQLLEKTGSHYSSLVQMTPAPTTTVNINQPSANSARFNAALMARLG